MHVPSLPRWMDVRVAPLCGGGGTLGRGGILLLTDCRRLLVAFLDHQLQTITCIRSTPASVVTWRRGQRAGRVYRSDREVLLSETSPGSPRSPGRLEPQDTRSLHEPPSAASHGHVPSRTPNAHTSSCPGPPRLPPVTHACLRVSTQTFPGRSGPPAGPAGFRGRVPTSRVCRQSGTFD